MEMEDFVTPRGSFENLRRSTSFSLCNSFVYSKLREEPIKLSVRKLDGSFFDVEIMKTATIAELKLAVEYVFSQIPDEGSGEISWPLVWGNFCLCYDGQKLVSDNDRVIIYGVKDDDQLHFVRHVSSIYNLKKSPSKRSSTRKQYRSKSSSSPNSTLGSKDDDDHDMVYRRYHSLTSKYQSLNDIKNHQSHITIQQERQFPLFRRSWYTYPKTTTSIKRGRRRRSSKGGRSCESELGCGLLAKFRNIIFMWDYSKNAPEWED